jgi:hypothetical protein
VWNTSCACFVLYSACDNAQHASQRSACAALPEVTVLAVASAHVSQHVKRAGCGTYHPGRRLQKYGPKSDDCALLPTVSKCPALKQCVRTRSPQTVSSTCKFCHAMAVTRLTFMIPTHANGARPPPALRSQAPAASPRRRSAARSPSSSRTAAAAACCRRRRSTRTASRCSRARTSSSATSS